MVVLDQGGVRQRHPVVDAAAGAHRCLLQRTQAGGGLAGVADARPGAVDGVDPGPGERRDAGQVAQQVERRALRGQQQPHRAGDLEHRLPCSGPLAVVPDAGDLEPVAEHDVEHRERGAQTGHHAVLPGHEGGGADELERDRRGAGDVDPAGEVLGDGPADQVLDVRRVDAVEGLDGLRTQGHALSRGSKEVPVRVVTRWPSQASEASGQSSRQCAPRVSSRRAAAATSAVATRCRSVASQAAGPGAAEVRAPSSSSAAEVAGERAGAAQDARAGRHRGAQLVAHGRVEQHRLGRSEDGLALRRQRPLEVRADAGGEDQPLEQAVGGQAVRAVHAGAGDLAAGVEAGDVGAAVQVGADAARGVVRSRCDRDRLGDRVDPRLAAAGHDGREALQQELLAEVARVEQHVVHRLLQHPAGDGLRDDVARGEVGQRVVGRGEDAAPLRVDEERALAAHRLRHQRLLTRRPGAEVERRGVELHELQVADGGARAQGERDAVAGRDRRVGGAGEHLAHAARGEHDRARVHRADAVLGALAEHVQRHARRTSVGGAQQVQDQGVLDQPDPRVRLDRGDQRALHLGPGRVAAGVHDPVAVVTALPGQRQLAGGVAVEGRTERHELAQPRRALLAEHAHGGDVAQPDAGDEGVAQVLLGAVVRAERGGDAALGPAGGAVVDEHLRHQQDRAGTGRVQGGGQPGHARADHDDVRRRRPPGCGSQQPRGRHRARVRSPRSRPLPGSASAGSSPRDSTRLSASTKTTRGTRVRASASSTCP